MSTHRAGMILAMAGAVLAGCSGFGKNQQPGAGDANIVPVNYRSTLVAFLRQSLTDPADFHGAMISQPALKTVTQSQRYVVCVQLNSTSTLKTTMAAVFLSGQMTQFIDATQEQCADAVYQPFKELDAAAPPVTSPEDLSDPRGTR